MNPENDTVSEIYAQKPVLPSPPSLQDVASALADTSVSSAVFSPVSSPKNATTNGGAISDLSTLLNENTTSPCPVGRSPKRGSPTTSTGSLRRRNRSAPRNSYEDYEERAVPALRQ